MCTRWITNNFLPSANEVCEGYVFTPVCHSVHRGGVCLSACLDTTPPQTRPGTPPGSRSPRTRHPSPGAEMATAADGTHPTGMHSCFLIIHPRSTSYLLIIDTRSPHKQFLTEQTSSDSTLDKAFNISVAYHKYRLILHLK